MKIFKKPQWITIVIAVLAIVLLLLLPRVEKPDTKLKLDEVEVSDSAEENDVEISETSQLVLDNILAEIARSDVMIDKIEWMDSLSNFWEGQGNLFKSADALYDIAEIINDKPSYLIAGDKYFQAFRDDDNSEKMRSLKKSIVAYEKILELDADDLEAMTSLAVCYIEGSQTLGEAPMKGIGLLRKVLEIDPDNINALVNLAYFSTQSGQFELAIERYEHVLEIDPNFLDAYLYLSDIYINSDNPAKAISYLEIYKSKISDPEIKRQLEIYIEKIKNK